MERSDPRRGQRRGDESRRERFGRGAEDRDDDRQRRELGSERYRDDESSSERYGESGGGRESWRSQAPDDDRAYRRRGALDPQAAEREGEGERDDERAYGRSGYGGDEDDERGGREQRYGGGRGERSQFSPDWSRQGAEPRHSEDRYYARNREYGRWRTNEGDWRGDENRRTTREERERGLTPRAQSDRGYGGSSRRQEHGDYGSDYESREAQGPERSRDEDEGRHYRGYYSRQVRPFSYPGGSGHLSVESWALSGPYAGRGPKGYKRSDEQIAEEACQRLERDGHVDASEIEVTAEDGVIRLRGTVSDRQMKRRAEECVESIYGAHDVLNELRVARPGEEGTQESRSASQRSQGGRSKSQAPGSQSQGSRAQASQGSQAARGSQASESSDAARASSEAGKSSASPQEAGEDKKSQKH